MRIQLNKFILSSSRRFIYAFILIALNTNLLRSEYIENEYWKEKSTCANNYQKCFLECMESYGIDFYNPPLFSPLRTTYIALCRSKCRNLFDCNAVYDRLKDKGAVK